MFRSNITGGRLHTSRPGIFQPPHLAPCKCLFKKMIYLLPASITIRCGRPPRVSANIRTCLPVVLMRFGRYSFQKPHSFALGPRPTAFHLSGLPINFALSSRYSRPVGVCSGHSSTLGSPGAWFGFLRRTQYINKMINIAPEAV